MKEKMTAKQYLLQSVKIRERMAFIRERIEKINADLGYHPVQLDDSGASHLNYREDKMSEKMAELVDLDTEYKEELVRLEKKNEEIRNRVELIENPEYRAVLTARYLTENRRHPCRLNAWVTVAFSLGLTSEEAAKQKHKRAINIFEKILRSDTL